MMKKMMTMIMMIKLRSLFQVLGIDIYGKCGNIRCSSYRDCGVSQGDKYFFYLAFENSFCHDYITEKMFKVRCYIIVIHVQLVENLSQNLQLKTEWSLRSVVK